MILVIILEFQKADTRSGEGAKAFRARAGWIIISASSIIELGFFFIVCVCVFVCVCVCVCLCVCVVCVYVYVCVCAGSYIQFLKLI